MGDINKESKDSLGENNSTDDELIVIEDISDEPFFPEQEKVLETIELPNLSFVPDTPQSGIDEFKPQKVKPVEKEDLSIDDAEVGFNDRDEVPTDTSEIDINLVSIKQQTEAGSNASNESLKAFDEVQDKNENTDRKSESNDDMINRIDSANEEPGKKNDNTENCEIKEDISDENDEDVIYLSQTQAIAIPEAVLKELDAENVGVCEATDDITAVISTNEVRKAVSADDYEESDDITEILPAKEIQNAVSADDYEESDDITEILPAKEIQNAASEDDYDAQEDITSEIKSETISENAVNPDEASKDDSKKTKKARDSKEAKPVIVETYPKKDVEFDDNGDYGVGRLLTGNFADKVIAVVAIFLVAAGLVVGSLWISQRLKSKGQAGIDTDPDMGTIGLAVRDQGTVAEDKINEIIEYQRTRVASIKEAEKTYEFDEVDIETGTIALSVSLTSICKDLKVKIINPKKRLVANVPFVVEVKGDDGYLEKFTDTNKDGIIYIDAINAGNYSVKLLPLTGYETMYFFEDVARSVTVKDKIEYKKVDVSNEVKTESQVNVAKEDTAKHGTVTESALSDTVGYCQSERVALTTEDGLIEIVDKSQSIADPFTVFSMHDIKVADALGDDTVVLADVSSNNPAKGIELSYSAKTIYLGNDLNCFTLNPIIGVQYAGHDYKWKSDDENIATVSQGTVTAVALGETTIKCYLADEKSVKATCKVLVVTDPRVDYSTLLTDNEGKQVYVYNADGNGYREAVYADYYSGATLYTKGEVAYKYTGWQEIDGATYYFDENGNAVTGEQVIMGARYNFASDGKLVVGTGTMGIDVSKWNGTIDWNAVASSGVSYAMIRCGFRGSTEGGLIKDSTFDYNMSKAHEVGIKTGVYFFTQAVTPAEAIEEASMVLDMVRGHIVSYPIFIDVESSGGRADSLSIEQRTEIIRAFCETIRNAGYTSGVYANRNWMTEKINTSELTSYKIWVAQYAASNTYVATRYDLWQYSERGTIKGINGYVDLNLSYLGY